MTQLRPAHPAEGEQVVHHLHRLGRGAPEHRHVGPLAGVESRAGALVQEAGEPAQLPERSPEIVAHRRGEGLQLGIDRRQCVGPFGDALLERGVELADRLLTLGHGHHRLAVTPGQREQLPPARVPQHQGHRADADQREPEEEPSGERGLLGALAAACLLALAESVEHLQHAGEPLDALAGLEVPDVVLAGFEEHPLVRRVLGPFPGHPLDNLQTRKLIRILAEEDPELLHPVHQPGVGPLERPEEGPVPREQIPPQAGLPVDQQLAEPGRVAEHPVRTLRQPCLPHEQRHSAAQSNREQREEDGGNEEGAGEQAPELHRLVHERRCHGERLGGRRELDGRSGGSGEPRPDLGGDLGSGVRRVHVSEGALF